MTVFEIILALFHDIHSEGDFTSLAQGHNSELPNVDQTTYNEIPF